MNILTEASELTAINISLSTFETCVWGSADTSTYRLKDRSNIVTTFRYKSFNGSYATFRVYGKPSTEGLQAVRRFGTENGLQIEARTTAWGKVQVQLGGDWARIS